MTKSTKEIAEILVRSGKSVIPVGRDKRPLVEGWKCYQDGLPDDFTVAEWFKHWPDANLAIITGKISGLVVIDCDSEDANNKFLDEFPEARSTTTVKTPRGYHYYFNFEEGVRNDAGKKIGSGIDVRGDGGYVLCPPSVGLSGDQYKYIHSVRPLRLPGTLREKLLRGDASGDRGHDSRNDGVDGGPGDETRVGQGGRNNFLTRLGGSQRHFNASYETILAALQTANIEQCCPPLPDSEVETIARSVCRYKPDVDTPPPAKRHHDLVTVRMDSVKREKVTWLWPNRVPLGRITMVEGDGGVCKSWVTMVIAAYVTQGKALPNEGGIATPKGSVVIMSAEDSLGETIKGRLEDNGADMELVHAIVGQRDEHGEKSVSLRDIDKISWFVEEVRPKLLVLDPVIAYLGGNDMNHAGSIRGLLAPLHAMAEKYEMAIILVRHLNKSTEQSAKFRGQGSVDFYSACRSAFHVIPDSQDRNKRHLVHIKSNLGPMQPTREFTVNDGVFQWGETNWHSAEELYKKLNNGSNKDSSEGSVRQRDPSYKGIL